MQKKQKGFTYVEIIITLMFLMVVGFISWYIYDKNNTQERKTTTQNSSDSPSSAKISGPNNLEINELGIKIKVPESLKGLTYKKLGSSSITFHMSDLDSLAYGCPESEDVPFQSWSKEVGQPDDDYEQQRLIKQFADFYIWRQGRPSGQICEESVRSQVGELVQKYATALYEEAEKTIELLDN